MKVGIDSYSYHRFFGEVYENQKKPARGMSYERFLKRAAALEVDGVSLETCFLESADESYLKRIREMLDEGKLEPVVAWGHPNGFEGGKNPAVSEDLKRHLKTCEMLGATVMRIVGSSLYFRNEPRAPQIRRLSRLLKEPAKMAGDRGIRLAMENHFDFTADEILEILGNVSSEYLGITYDTGNALRIGDDPVKAAKKLGPHIFATHTKDVAPIYGGDPRDWFYFACVPVGKGVIDFPALVKTLEGAGYRGLFAIEIDYPHPDYAEEDDIVEKSVRYLKKLARG
jgi:sugar phosphate isomerase/epimerase